MVQATQDGNLRDKVIFQLLVELVHIDRLDCDRSLLLLHMTKSAFISSRKEAASSIWAESGRKTALAAANDGKMERTYDMYAAVDLRKATLPNVVHALELPYYLL